MRYLFRCFDPFTSKNYFMGFGEAALGVALVGGAVAAGGAVAGAEISAGATQSAADKQAQAASSANALQLYEFNQQQANIQPWLTAGTGAINTLSAGTQPGGQFSTAPTFNFNPNAITQDPGYAFRYQQGVNAITGAGSAAGNLGSGNLGVALTNYGQQAGSQEYQNAYQRAYQSQLDAYNSQVSAQNTVFNRLSGVAGTGQTANSQLSSAGQNYANSAGNNLMTSATNQGNIGMNQANNNANMVGNVTNQLMGGVGAYNQNQLMSSYLQQQQYNNMGDSGWGTWADGSSANGLT